MVNHMAVRMEIQSFLTDGRSRKNERPEGRIESLPTLPDPNEGFAVVVADIAKPHREAAANGEFFHANMALPVAFRSSTRSDEARSDSASIIASATPLTISVSRSGRAR